MSKQDFFKNQKILLTGASEGIGAAVAEQLAAEGASLFLVARNQERLNQLAERLQPLQKNSAQEILVLPCDLCEPDQVDQLILRLKFYSINGVIHNAGAGVYGVASEIPEVEVRRLFELNFFSVQKLTRGLLPQLQNASQARLVFISSIVSWRAIPRMGYYSATKAALNSYVEALRIELAKTSIKIVNVYPGRTKTNFSVNAYSQGWRPFSTEYGRLSAKKVAEKIILAYLKGKRDEYVTFSNRLLIWFNFLFPKWVDWGLVRFFKNSKGKKQSNLS